MIEYHPRKGELDWLYEPEPGEKLPTLSETTLWALECARNASEGRKHTIAEFDDYNKPIGRELRRDLNIAACILIDAPSGTLIVTGVGRAVLKAAGK